MKPLFMTALVLSMFGLWGCTTSSQGGPMGSDQGFKIHVPEFGATVKQGEIKSAKVTLKRGKYFKQDVTVKLEASRGISVKPTDVIVKASEEPTIPIQITVPKDAAIGEYRIHVQGTPESGALTAINMKVKVKAFK